VQACTEIDADRYIDYIELDAASNRSIDEIRDLIERAAYKPGVGRFKVFMIDEAHQLTKDAFNALLKTLEEPPEYLKFVLATTDPEKMLPTVLSRCLQFNLRPMAPEVVRDHLPGAAGRGRALRRRRAAPARARRPRVDARRAVADRPGHRLRRRPARRGGGARHARQRGPQPCRRPGAGAGRARRPCAAGRGGRAARPGLSASGTLEEMATLLQQMAVVQAVPDALDAADPDHEDALRLASALAADETQLLYSMVLQGRGELGLMGDEYAALTMVLLRFMAFPPAGSPVAAVAPRRRRPRCRLRAWRGAHRRPPCAAGSRSRCGGHCAACPRCGPGAAARRQHRALPPPRGAPAAEPDIPPWVDEGPPPEDEGRARARPLRRRRHRRWWWPRPRAGGDRGSRLRRRPRPRRWATAGRCGCSRWASRGASRAGARTGLAGRRAACVDGAGGCTWTLVVERESLRTDTLADKLAAALSAELRRPQQLVLEPACPPIPWPAAKPGSACAARPRPSS
jgi:DNA polymerase-3 subunit gamma/tau